MNLLSGFEYILQSDMYSLYVCDYFCFASISYNDKQHCNDTEKTITFFHSVSFLMNIDLELMILNIQVKISLVYVHIANILVVFIVINHVSKQGDLSYGHDQGP
jgi:hypothetical protein